MKINHINLVVEDGNGKNKRQFGSYFALQDIMIEELDAIETLAGTGKVQLLYEEIIVTSNTSAKNNKSYGHNRKIKDQENESSICSQ